MLQFTRPSLDFKAKFSRAWPSSTTLPLFQFSTAVACR